MNKPQSSNKKKRSLYDSQKIGKPISFENTEKFENNEFKAFLNEQHDQIYDNDLADGLGGDIPISHNFKSQTTTIPFHSSLGTDFLNLFANGQK